MDIQVIMFIVGSIIFILYMLGLLTMINRSHKEQENEFKNLSNGVDEMDMDGMGNFSRFPNKENRMEEYGYRKVRGDKDIKVLRYKKRNMNV